MEEAASCPVLHTSVKNEADLHAKNIELYSDKIRYTAICGDEQVPVEVPIPGRFTVYNTLTVLGIAMQLGISLADAAQALKTAKGVKGRIEVVPTPGKDYTIIIDYAHSHDSLENILTSVKDFCKGRLIAVFGSSGGRDPGKRPLMGEVGARVADIAVITTDNARWEDPFTVIQEMLVGIPDQSNCVVIVDRTEAIHYAMDIAEKDDIIVLAGRGHELYQESMGVKVPMDERKIVAEYL